MIHTVLNNLKEVQKLDDLVGSSRELTFLKEVLNYHFPVFYVQTARKNYYQEINCSLIKKLMNDEVWLETAIMNIQEVKKLGGGEVHCLLGLDYAAYYKKNKFLLIVGGYRTEKGQKLERKLLHFRKQQVQELPIEERKKVKSQFRKIEKKFHLCFYDENERIYKEAEAILLENFSQTYTLTMLSEKIFYNEKKISQAIKKVSKKSFRDFYLDLKMKKIKQLLKEGELSLLEIAKETGYSCRQSFEKAVKKYFGVSPKQLLEKN